MISIIFDILFPANCLICGRLGNYLCSKCFSKLRSASKDICPVCLAGSYMGFTHKKCVKPYTADGLKTFYYYDRNFKKLLSAIKYKLASRGMPELLEWFCAQKNQQIHEFLKYTGKIDYLVAVPLSIARQKRRGFNQSSIVAKYLSEALSIAVCDDLVLKIKDTVVQAKLDTKSKRINNVRGVFCINKKSSTDLCGKKILLIDDVWTSGATAEAITNILKKEAKVAKVFVFALARSHN